MADKLPVNSKDMIRSHRALRLNKTIKWTKEMRRKDRVLSHAKAMAGYKDMDLGH